MNSKAKKTLDSAIKKIYEKIKKLEEKHWATIASIAIPFKLNNKEYYLSVFVWTWPDYFSLDGGDFEFDFYYNKGEIEFICPIKTHVNDWWIKISSTNEFLDFKKNIDKVFSDFDFIFTNENVITHYK